jgi:hypothetical protein
MQKRCVRTVVIEAEKPTASSSAQPVCLSESRAGREQCDMRGVIPFVK